MGHRARIHRVRRKIRPAGGCHFRVRHRFIARLRRLHRLHRVNVGVALTGRLFRPRPRSVASAKVNVIQPAKKHSSTAKIFAGVASTDTSFRSMRPNAKNTVASAIRPERRRFSIAGNCVGAASTARLCRFRWLIAGKGTVNVSVPGKQL